MWAGGAAAGGTVGQLWSCAEVGGPMPTVSATAPATATRRPPSLILTHRLRWRIAAHLVGDEVFTFGRPRCLYCKPGQLQGRKVRPPPASSLLGLPEPNIWRLRPGSRRLGRRRCRSGCSVRSVCSLRPVCRHLLPFRLQPRHRSRSQRTRQPQCTHRRRARRWDSLGPWRLSQWGGLPPRWQRQPLP